MQPPSAQPGGGVPVAEGAGDASVFSPFEGEGRASDVRLFGAGDRASVVPIDVGKAVAAPFGGNKSSEPVLPDVQADTTAATAAWHRNPPAKTSADRKAPAEALSVMARSAQEPFAPKVPAPRRARTPRDMPRDIVELFAPLHRRVPAV